MMVRAAAFLFACWTLSFAATASAGGCGVFEVDRDWSDDENPNGSWSYLQGSTPLPQVAAWQRNLGGWARFQSGWADSEDGNDRLPFWFRSNGSETFENDFHRCDVVVHTLDDINGVGNGVATLQWTAPIDTTVSVSGAVWMGRDIGRANDWMLYRNDTLLSQGSIASGDQYSRANPFFLADGSGGAAALDAVSMDAGEALRLVLVRSSTAGEFVGVKLRIECAGANAAAGATTTTTLFYPQCGDPVYPSGQEEPATEITASDALHVLRTAIGVISCDLCVCDTNDNGSVTAGDALVVLRRAVGSPATLNCPYCPC